jgi:hypothetical protein
MSYRGYFRRELLPAPKPFLERELGQQLGRPGRNGWSKGNCPFHRSKSGKSFSFNVVTGAFYCFGCGAHGGDILQFVRLRYQLSFKEAAIRLGAWDGAPTPATVRELAAVRHGRERQREAEERQRAERRERLLLLRDRLHTALRLQREAIQQLDEIHRGGGDEEPCWELLSLLADYARECDREYCRVAGLECSE